MVVNNKKIVVTEFSDRELFTPIYHSFLRSKKLNGKEKLLYIVLKSFLDIGKREGKVFPTIETICDMVTMSKPTVINILKSLKKKGVLEIEQRGLNKPNVYTLYDYKALWENNKSEEDSELEKQRKEQEAIAFLKSRGYQFTSKEKEPVSAVTQTTDTSTHKSNLHNYTTDESESQEPCPTSEADADALLDRLWALYPIKKGKGQISVAQRKKLLKIGYDEMARAIERYKQYVESVDYLHYKNGNTFFNGGYIDYLDANYDPESEREARSNQEKSGQAKSVQTKNRFNDYPRRDYDFDAIKKSMFDQ